jgi:hypothetical protein
VTWALIRENDGLNGENSWMILNLDAQKESGEADLEINLDSVFMIESALS